MSDIDNGDSAHVRKSERTWLGRPLTTGAAIALLGANLMLMLLIAAYIAHRLDLLDIYVGSINTNM